MIHKNWYLLHFYFCFNVFMSSSFIELQVNVHDIDSILGNMAFKLTAEELNDLTPNLPVNGEKLNSFAPSREFGFLIALHPQENFG